MKQQIEDLRQAAQAAEIHTPELLEQYRLQFLSRNGSLNELFEAFKTVPPAEKKEYGQILNQLKQFVQGRFDGQKEIFEQADTGASSGEDLTLPGTGLPLGARHPLQLVQNRICEIFGRLGFNIAEGPEIEDDWHNFTSLNFPENHPARDMQDTFFIDEKDQIALRTHTSSVQVRLMESTKPPIRSLMPGRVYRNEAISARAHCFFHQVEGLYIDKNVSFADLKQTLFYFVQEMFGQDVKVRFRASFFPFTEPSAEMDVSCFICGGPGCNVCKHSGWVEILGCGMVDPQVLQNCGIDPEVYSGFAFGMGIERITMLKYGVNDLRIYSENDIRFLSQFHQNAW